MHYLSLHHAGVKEVWQMPEGRVKPGYIQHTLGWPLQTSLTRYVCVYVFRIRVCVCPCILCVLGTGIEYMESK